MKKILFTITFAVLAMVGNSKIAGAEEANNNYAVINIVSIMQDAKVMQNIQSQIDVYKNTLQKQAAVQQTNLKQDEQALINQQPNLSPKAFDTEKNKFAKKVEVARDSFESKSAALSKAGNDAVNTVQGKLANIVSDIAKKEHYAMIYQSNALAFYPNERDITKSVLTKLNAAITKVQVKRPF